MAAELAESRAREDEAEQQRHELETQLEEALALADLQKADIERYRTAFEKVRPNTPERVPKEQLQLAFERVLESLSDVPSASDWAANQDRNRSSDQPKKKPSQQNGQKNRHNHTRRQLDLTNLPLHESVIDPDEVVSANGEGYDLVGEEVADRVAFRPGSYIRLRTTRRKWVKKSEAVEQEAASAPGNVVAPSPMVVAPVPKNLWPSFMADTSVIAEHIIAKYGDVLPLHRQERISARNGFRVPRSTQCGWLGEGHRVLYRIVDAMHAEAVRRAFCIATDATGAPVRASNTCDNWHIFVFVADHDHVFFRYSEDHSSEAIQRLLTGFRGHLLADAAPIYDALYRDGVTEVVCWFHARRYFWRALESDPKRALEALSLIGKLFEIERECKDLPLAEHTAKRAREARPILEMLDAWVKRNRDDVDPRGPLDKAIGYYLNQRDALHRFVEDGRLRLDNGPSEQQLRNVALGRHNWLYFANETGLKWYTVFRSLVASCQLHDINPREYLEQVLRLAPHWRVSRMLELAPKYWKTTVQRLSPEQLRILVPPWQQTWPRVASPPEPAERPLRQSA